MWVLHVEENDLPTINHAEAAKKALGCDLRKVHPQISECIEKKQERIIEQTLMVCVHRNCKPPRTNNQTELVLQVQGEQTVPCSVMNCITSLVRTRWHMGCS